MALVSTRTASHADIHKELERTELAEPLLKPFQDDLFPVIGQLPVIIHY